MDASNLATLFAPNILHKPIKELSPNDLSEEMTMERRLAIDVVTALIVNYEYLFKVQWNIYNNYNPIFYDNLLRKLAEFQYFVKNININLVKIHSLLNNWISILTQLYNMYITNNIHLIFINVIALLIGTVIV